MGIETALALGSAAAGLAATGAGAVMSHHAQKQAGQDAAAMADARNKQLQQYRQRMAGLQEQTQANNQKTQELYGPDEAKKRETEAEGGLNKNYTAATADPTPLAGIPLGGSAPEVTGAASAKAKEGTDNYTAMLAKRLAALGTQPQALLGSGTSLQRA